MTMIVNQILTASGTGTLIPVAPSPFVTEIHWEPVIPVDYEG